MRKRRLFLEALEKRLVLSGVGQPDADQSGADWQSVIVSFKADVGDTRATASALMQSVGGQLGHVYGHALQGFSAHLPAAAVQGLSNNPLVQSIEPNQVVQACGWPAGAPYVVPHGVDRIDADLPIDADSPQDWSSVDVAIIDTGIDPDHPDLNVNEVGIHFYTRLTGPPSQRGSQQDDIFADDSGHGSHVAGIVGAKDDEFGVVGVAPGARLWGVKVLDSRGYGTVADVIAGVDWVVEYHAADIEVINMSLGLWGRSDVLREAIQGAVDAGIVVVVAAGNDGRDVYGPDGVLGGGDDFIPAAYPEVATISAMVETDGIPGGFGPDSGSGPDDTFASFSNYGSSSDAIDLVLPGVNLWSTWYDGSFVQQTGTSMAAPHAAGLAARYIAENYDLATGDVPDSSEDVYAVRQALIDNAIAQDDLRGLGFESLNDPDGNLEPIGWAGPSHLADYPPAVAVISPAAGEIVSGTVTLNAIVVNDDGIVDRVEFFVDDSSIGLDTDSYGGWSISWDTTADLPDGLHMITATATEKIGETEGDQSGSSSPIFVTVANGTVSDAPPSVSVTSPEDGDTVSGTVTVTAYASDDNGVDQVEFFVDGVSIGVDMDDSDGWSATWDTSTVSDGSYPVTATATDTILQTASHGVSVTVDNVQAADTMHIEDLDGSTRSIGKSGKWQALVDVSIVDASNAGVSGALVTGTWTGAATGSVFGLTGSDGIVTLISGTTYISDSVTFTVDSVSHSEFTYESGDNLETEITISPPQTARRSLTTAAEADSLEAMYRYLAGTAHSNKEQSGKKDADEQAAPVDLALMPVE